VSNGGTCLATDKWLKGIQGPRVEVSFLPKRTSMAKAANYNYRLLQETWKTDYVLSVQNDMMFSSVWMAPLLRVLEEDPRVGMISPGIITQLKLYGAPNIAGLYALSYQQALRTVESTSKWVREEYTDYERFRPGFAMPSLCRTDMIDEVGLCEENFPASQTFEDTELLYRIDKAGWKVLMDRSTWVYHAVELTRGVILAIDQRTKPGEFTQIDAMKANCTYCEMKYGVEEWEKWMVVFQERLRRLWERV
jgi:GT2 family glycosyltransferase